MNSRQVPVPRHKIPLKPGKTLAAWMHDKNKVQAYFNFLDLWVKLAS